MSKQVFSLNSLHTMQFICGFTCDTTVFQSYHVLKSSEWPDSTHVYVYKQRVRTSSNYLSKSRSALVRIVPLSTIWQRHMFFRCEWDQSVGRAPSWCETWCPVTPAFPSSCASCPRRWHHTRKLQIRCVHVCSNTCQKVYPIPQSLLTRTLLTS